MKIQKYYWLMLCFPVLYLVISVFEVMNNGYGYILLNIASIISHVSFGYMLFEQLKSRFEKRGIRLAVSISGSFLIFTIVKWVIIKVFNSEFTLDVFEYLLSVLTINLDFLKIYQEYSIPVEYSINGVLSEFAPYLGMAIIAVLALGKNNEHKRNGEQVKMNEGNGATTVLSTRPTFCPNCGVKVETSGDFCPSCGTKFGGVIPASVEQANSSKSGDGNSVGMNVLSFLFPIIGLILYLVWQNDYPIKAKNVGKWALIGFILGLIGGVIYYFSMMSLLSSMYY